MRRCSLCCSRRYCVLPSYNDCADFVWVVLVYRYIAMCIYSANSYSSKLIPHKIRCGVELGECCKVICNMKMREKRTQRRLLVKVIN